MSNDKQVFIQVNHDEAIDFLMNRVSKLQETLCARDEYILTLQEEIRNLNKDLAIPDTIDYITRVVNKSDQIKSGTNPDLIKSDSDDDNKIESIVPGKAYSPRKGNRRLTDTQVVLVKELLASGVSVGDISKQMDIFPGIISGIRAGLTYREDLPLPISNDNNVDSTCIGIVESIDNTLKEEGVSND